MHTTWVEPVNCVDLFGVVVVNEGFYCLNRGVDRAWSDPRWQRAGQPAGNPPQWQQPAAHPRRQKLFNRREMSRFGFQMLLRKSSQGHIAGRGQDAAINHHGSGFASMISAQV